MPLRDEAVVAGRSEDEASVSLPTDGYGDPCDAAVELLYTLSTVPGLTPPSEWPDADDVLDLFGGAGKTPAELGITDPGGEWQLNVTIGADTAELRCKYDGRGYVSDREDTFYSTRRSRSSSTVKARHHLIPCGRSTNGSSSEPRRPVSFLRQPQTVGQRCRGVRHSTRRSVSFSNAVG
jgi:hypothetical protein